jgi:hypothetical protein
MDAEKSGLARISVCHPCPTSDSIRLFPRESA